MIKIQDVTIPTRGVASYLNVTALNFAITPTAGISLYWQLFEETTTTNAETQEEESSSGKMLLDGNLQLPQEQYDAWGTDDSVITDWVMEQLNLTV